MNERYFIETKTIIQLTIFVTLSEIKQIIVNENTFM
jgi:hypothetical protein